MISIEVQKLEQENEALKMEVEKYKAELGRELSKPKDCEHCQFYIQHYVRVGNSYGKTYCGHCVHGRTKNRKPEDTCQYFKFGYMS